ncbi:MAG: DNA-processing protein DprA [Prevotella sp.]|jgi:DNA processing protein|nr:DNA-processing protein DprA [Prevotella sp.]
MSPTPDKRLYQIALTKINGVGDITARNILNLFDGDEAAIFSSDRQTLLHKGVPTKLIPDILSPGVIEKAEKELAFIEKNNISTYFINEKDYPGRLRECVDAPILLYFRGNTNFNADKIISIVGTRQSTNYGNNFCESFLEELSSTIPDALIVSGLAYGIDIHAHKAAIKYGFPTIGVLAHGLDRIYPSFHRQTAVKMIENGGLLTEFPNGTDPEKFNFVRRNRIVAGMADAVIIVESDIKGGSLITAELANSYCKDVFSLPGRTSDKYSQGCNKLIASHKADIFYSTEYFLEQMSWDLESNRKKKRPKQQALFIELNDDEQKIVDILTGRDSTHVDQLSLQLEIPVFQLFSLLLELEMKGVIKNMPGNTYSLT